MVRSLRQGITVLMLVTAASAMPAMGADAAARSAVTALPAPVVDGKLSLEAALQRRASVRKFKAAPIALADAGQLLWAAQGISHEGDKRTAPSAGALYPLEIYLLAGTVEGLAPGAYRYDMKRHALDRVKAGQLLAPLADAALGQGAVRGAAAVLLLTATPARTTGKYGERAHRFVWVEAGHAAQNVLLQAVARGLGAVSIGAFDDAAVARLLALPAGEQPVYLIPVGKPAG